MQTTQTQHAKALAELGIYNTQHQANVIIQHIQALANELSIKYPQYGFENHTEGYHALLECRDKLELVYAMIDDPHYEFYASGAL